MKNLAIARRYAKALLLIGKEDGQTEQYRQELGGVAKLMIEQKMLADVVSNPLYNADERKRVCEGVLG
jgi:F-type H+-transporting ATPase subunit delta